MDKNRQELLYREIIKRAHDTSQIQPFYKSGKLLLGCLFFVAGMAAGYFQPAMNSEDRINDISVVFYSPFYNKAIDEGGTNGNE